MAKTITRKISIFINGKEVENNLNSVGKSIGKLRGQIRNLTPGTQEFINKSKELKKAQKAYKDINDEIRDTNVSLEEAQSHFSNLFGGLVSGNFKMVQSGLQGIATNIKGMTKAALTFIATPLGAAIAVVAGIALGAKKWVEFNLEVEKTNQLVKDLTQETGLAVDAIRVRAEVLQDTFGADMQKTITTAKSLVDNLGISYDEAFDIIEDGAVRGKLKNDEFLESLKEYPSQFNNAGFSAKEFAAIVNTGIDLSIYKDKLPDAIKEFTLSITEQTDAARNAMINAFGSNFTNKLFNDLKNGATTPKEALQSIALEAEKIGLNSQQAQLLTADLFKGAGEDAGGALKVFEAVNIALNEQAKPLTEIQQLQQEQLNINKELNGVYTQLFASADGGFGKLIAKGKIFATQVLLKILKGGVDVYNWFVDLNNESGAFSAVLTTIGKSAANSFSISIEFLKLFVNQLKASGTIIEGVFTLDWEKVKSGYSKGFENLGTSFENLKTKAVNAFADIQTAWNGGNKAEYISLDSLVSNEGTGTNTTTPTTTTTTPTPNTTSGSGESELTAEDQKIIASKKKVAEFLKQFREEQEIQEKIEDLEKDEAAALKEELELEAKYLKLREEAYGETELLKELEENKKIELAAIDKKWKDKFLADNKKYRDQEQKQNEEAFQKQLAARKQLNTQIINGAINLAGQESRIGQALLAVKGILAAKETLISLGVLKDKIAINAAGATGDIAEGTAKTAKVGFPQNIPLLIAFAAQAVGIISAVKNATKAANSIKPTTTGYKTGGYTGAGSADDVAGIQHKDEYVVPQFILQDPTYAPVLNQLEQKRTETLGVQNSLPTQVSNSGTSNNDLLTSAVLQLISKLDEPIMAAALIGDNQINDLTTRTEKLKQVRNNAKIQ